MKEAVIRRFAAWEDVEPLAVDAALWRPAGEIRAWAQIAWEPDALRVELTAREARVRAEEKGPLGRPWEDSCLECFLAPMMGEDRYFNIELNPNACLCLGLGDGAERVRLLPERDWLGAEAFTLPDGWGVRYRVPFQFIRLFFPPFAPGLGTALRGNFYKCGDRTESPHYLAWNPVNSPVPNFHRPGDFGLLRMV